MVNLLIRCTLCLNTKLQLQFIVVRSGFRYRSLIFFGLYSFPVMENVFTVRVGPIKNREGTNIRGGTKRNNKRTISIFNI